MRYDLDVAGFEGRELYVEMKGLGEAKILLDQQPAPPADKKGQFMLTRNDGHIVTAQFRAKFPNPVPTLVVDGQEYQLMEPFQWYEWIVAGLPLVLILVGGCIGGALGGMGFYLNARILRSDMPPIARYAIALGISTLALILSILVAGMVHLIFPAKA